MTPALVLCFKVWLLSTTVSTLAMFGLWAWYWFERMKSRAQLKALRIRFESQEKT